MGQSKGASNTLKVVVGVGTFEGLEEFPVGVLNGVLKFEVVTLEEVKEILEFNVDTPGGNVGIGLEEFELAFRFPLRVVVGIRFKESTTGCNVHTDDKDDSNDDGKLEVFLGQIDHEGKEENFNERILE